MFEDISQIYIDEKINRPRTRFRKIEPIPEFDLEALDVPDNFYSNDLAKMKRWMVKASQLIKWLVVQESHRWGTASIESNQRAHNVKTLFALLNAIQIEEDTTVEVPYSFSCPYCHEGFEHPRTEYMWGGSNQCPHCGETIS